MGPFRKKIWCSVTILPFAENGCQRSKMNRSSEGPFHPAFVDVDNRDGSSPAPTKSVD